jgi:hypothetical protein
MRGDANKTVRDREAPGSNPGLPTNFVFKIADSRPCLESPAHRRITISYGASKPRLGKACCRGTS